VSSATKATTVKAKPKSESLEFFMATILSDLNTLDRREQRQKVTDWFARALTLT
jgi:hypothetical protein